MPVNANTTRKETLMCRLTDDKAGCAGLAGEHNGSHYAVIPHWGCTSFTLHTWKA